VPEKIENIAQYAEERIDRSGDCWLWTGSLNTNGYGIVWFRPNGVKTGYLAHRLVWELINGPIPEGLKVLHRCDNPPCVRIEHLSLGTQSDNIADRHAKGRTARGETHCRAKLLDQDVSDIRALSARGVSRRAILEEYKISQPYLSRLLRGKRRA